MKRKLLFQHKNIFQHAFLDGFSIKYIIDKFYHTGIKYFGLNRKM